MLNVEQRKKRHAGTVQAIVKFFNAGRGFGFVTVLGPNPIDAFLHCSTLQNGGLPLPAAGAVITCKVETRRKGPEVTSVEAMHGVDDVVERVPRVPDVILGDGPRIEATVKFFSFERGYGFLISDGHGEIFLHLTTMAKSGVSEIKDGQRLVVDTVLTHRGVQVSHIVSVG